MKTENRITYRKCGRAYRIAIHAPSDKTSAGALLNFVSTIKEAKRLYPTATKF